MILLRLFVLPLEAAKLQFDVSVDGDVDGDDGEEDDVARHPGQSDPVPVGSYPQITVGCL